MGKYGVALKLPWKGVTVTGRTFFTKAAAEKYARKIAQEADITANAAVFRVGYPDTAEWVF
jgi:hypothetical protein